MKPLAADEAELTSLFEEGRVKSLLENRKERQEPS